MCTVLIALFPPAEKEQCSLCSANNLNKDTLLASSSPARQFPTSWAWLSAGKLPVGCSSLGRHSPALMPARWQNQQQPTNRPQQQELSLSLFLFPFSLQSNPQQSACFSMRNSTGLLHSRAPQSSREVMQAAQLSRFCNNNNNHQAACSRLFRPSKVGLSAANECNSRRRKGTLPRAWGQVTLFCQLLILSRRLEHTSAWWAHFAVNISLNFQQQLRIIFFVE